MPVPVSVSVSVSVSVFVSVSACLCLCLCRWTRCACAWQGRLGEVVGGGVLWSADGASARRPQDGDNLGLGHNDATEAFGLNVKD